LYLSGASQGRSEDAVDVDFDVDEDAPGDKDDDDCDDDDDDDEEDCWFPLPPLPRDDGDDEK